MKIYNIIVAVILAISFFGCAQMAKEATLSPYQLSYQRETRRLKYREEEKAVRRIAIVDARQGECVLHPFSEVPLRWVSYYFDTCEQEQRWIFQQSLWRDSWRRERDRQRGRRDAWRNFYSR